VSRPSSSIRTRLDAARTCGRRERPPTSRLQDGQAANETWTGVEFSIDINYDVNYDVLHFERAEDNACVVKMKISTSNSSMKATRFGDALARTVAGL
jgi:hypothetical protein